MLSEDASRIMKLVDVRFNAAIPAYPAYCTSPKTAAYQWTHNGTLGLSAPMSLLLSLGSGKGLPKLLFQNLAGRVTQLPSSCSKSYTQENLATVQEAGQRDGKHKSQHMR